MLQVRVRNERQDERVDHESGPLEFGRLPKTGCERVVVEDRYVSRDQLRIEPLPDGSLRLTNLGSPFTLSDGTTLQKAEVRTVKLPVKLTVGYTSIELTSDEPGSQDPSLQTISRPVTARSVVDRFSSSSLASLGDSPSPQTLATWFERLLSVQRAAAGSDEFYDETARAVVDLVGLDCGMVMLQDGERWDTRAIHTSRAKLGSRFSQSVLNRVLDQKRTYYQMPTGSSQAASLMMVEAVVASPIFDQQGEIVGIVYGSRDMRTGQEQRGITALEAQVVQLLAGAVSAGLARMEREAEATRVRLQFEQFTSPVVARELERNPDLMEGREREITVLFADLRGFSRISEKLGARETYKLIGDVMDELTQRVLDEAGVIVDYYGDGLAAMWNAPIEQPEHAAQACRAALKMQHALPGLDQRWLEITKQPLRIGSGINTGAALVGNAGSTRRNKYGPRGHAVNLASRVEGATKYLGVPILVTTETKARLGDDFITRRLCSVRVVGMQEPVSLFELYDRSRVEEEAAEAWLEMRDQYEEALLLFEEQQFEPALAIVDSLAKIETWHEDLAIGRLRERIQRHQDQPQEAFDSVFQLDAK